MRVLIVEDEIIPATYLKKILTSHHYEVIKIVNSGREAIEVAKSEKPDIILMDIMLKDNISGAEAGEQIHFLLPEILIIFLTSFSDKEMIEYAVQSEAFAYLLKPYRDEEILATLQLASSKLSKRQNQAKTSESTIISLVDGYHYDKEVERLFFEEKEVSLGGKGLQLIQLLCNNTHITLKIETILEVLWDEPKPQQTLRSLIHRIREKTSPRLIQNLNKFGYKIRLDSQ